MSGFSIDSKLREPKLERIMPFFDCTRIAARAAGLTMKVRLISFALFVAGLSACSGFRQGSSTTDSSSSLTVVQVDNQGFLDMTVYAERSSQRIRLGIANGNSKTNLNVPSVLMSGLTPLRFVADPIGGRRASVSQEITVAPGDTVVLQIPPV
jgi:hypothetical protein